MKKIKSIQQLQAEKKQLLLQQHYLEQKMREEWQELKFSLKPSALAGNAINRFISHKTEQNPNGENSILKTTLAYGISLLAKKIITKAETAIHDKLKKNTSGR